MGRPKELTEQKQLGNAPATESEVTEMVVKYLPLVKSIAGKYRGRVEYEDLVQEGLIGLLSAIRNYSPQKGASFSTFAYLCVSRRILTALKSQALSVQQPFAPLTEEDPVPGEDPISRLIEQQDFHERYRRFEAILSGFEKDTLRLYLGGYSYEEMSLQLQSTVKSVDNALQRIRRKLRLVVAE